FALLLGSYLAGIAFGSLFTEWFCRSRRAQTNEQQLGIVGILVVFANVIGFLVAPFLSNTIVFFGLTGGLVVVMIAAAMLGATFPLVAHIAIPPDSRVGARLSYLYLSNIIGSASGSFVVGFILMDYLSMRQLSVVLALLGLAMGLSLLLASTRHDMRRMASSVALCVVMAATVVLSSGNLFNRIYEKLLYKQQWHGETFRYTVETRSGVVNVANDGTVFGGGIYDGRFNTDVVHDTNWIIRAYALSALHPNPRKVLMIGLSSGSWAQVIVNNPQVEKMTIVEINPGYLRLIERYPEVASVLKNPKVEMFIDDGRRWLIAHPNEKFDAVVMNTTWHFRDHASSLLSEDFLRIIRQHLKPGGIHYYNTTESTEVMRTGAMVFPYSMRFFNFFAVSDSPFQIDGERWRNVLVKYQIDGKPVFHLDRPEELNSLNGIVSFAQRVGPSDKLASFEPGDDFPQRFRNSRLITDDNMGTEWFY
ncbi:MAG: spermidine synthase, partial [Terriglobales bacterium]